jgi:hypothetical protein
LSDIISVILLIHNLSIISSLPLRSLECKLCCLCKKMYFSSLNPFLLFELLMHLMDEVMPFIDRNFINLLSCSSIIILDTQKSEIITLWYFENCHEKLNMCI